ncbi:troponin I 4-like [Tropilaelaps mercedesae]|uniref:Troponin I 4-like n=1 Tax=Tropilaelaps mercedesae TaxID=418985 RepID=A0A1V9X1J5_9ACAR|nr:troponin I 4-like [Tropilaelaps mercedesae]
MSDEEQRKMEEKERKKAEVRKRLEEASKAKKGGKGGFMTPDRKKKLRALLRKKAAEELKKEQERKAEHRRKTIADRCGQPKSVDTANEAALQQVLKDYHKRIGELEDKKYDLEYEVRQKDFLVIPLVKRGALRGAKALCACQVRGAREVPRTSLQAICKEYYQRIMQVESEKYDLEYSVRLKDYQINELNIQVNDLRGKFIKPALKKVSKFDKLKVKTDKTELDFRSGLKSVKKDFKELTEETKPAEKPQWALGAKKETEAADAEE